MWICACECWCLQVPEGLNAPGSRAAVKGGCEPPRMDAGKGIWVYCKNDKLY